MCCINSLFVFQLSVQKTPPLLQAAIFTGRKDADLTSDPDSKWLRLNLQDFLERCPASCPCSSTQQKRGAREASRYTGQGGKDAAELTEGFTTEKQLALASLAAVDHLFIMRRLCAHSRGDRHRRLWQNNAGMSGKKLLNQVQQSGRLG